MVKSAHDAPSNPTIPAAVVYSGIVQHISLEREMLISDAKSLVREKMSTHLQKILRVPEHVDMASAAIYPGEQSQINIFSVCFIPD